MESTTRLWFRDILVPNTFQLSRVKGIIYSGRTQIQSIDILETESFGRTLVLDGRTQSAEADEFIYHESLVHPPMLTHPAPRKVFIGGGGEGATLREVLAHRSVKKVVMVDIDQEAVELCRTYLPSFHQGSFEDKRLELHFTDVREFFIRHREKFDIILMDITDPTEGSPSSRLFTVEFYNLAQRRLSPGGVICVQAGPTVHGDTKTFCSIVNTLRKVFPVVYPYEAHIPSFGVMWGFALASAGPDPLIVMQEEINRSISTRISRPLRFYDGQTHQKMFSLPKFLREELAGEKRAITERGLT
ncbi:MAG: polyamine aminopropyltransferase [Chloroflexi bacterium]|nr:polyamine aminopropyltransferase [Chloroflexota bacterium]